MEPEEPGEIPLPPLQMADLDEATLLALFTDVELLGRDVEVTVKRGAEAHVSRESPTLAVALQALRSGEALGVQLRYSHQGALYLDTVMRTRPARGGGPESYRLVRIQPL